MWLAKSIAFTILAGVVFLSTHYFSQSEVSGICSYSMDVSFPNTDAGNISRTQFLFDSEPLLTYIDYVSFNWSHWVDLEDTKIYETKELDAEQFPDLKSLDPETPYSTLYRKKGTWQEKALLGKLYCKHELPIPFRVIHVLDNQEVRQYKPWHENATFLHRQIGHILPAQYYTLSIKPKNPTTNYVEYLYPRIAPEEFTLPVEELIESEDVPEQHRQSLYVARSEAPISGKYFFEINVSDPGLRGGNHYDWRFFRRFLTPHEIQKALHRIAVDWQAFAEAVDLHYWYAHGSMIGYKWNGMTLPWDTDHDIQMPVRSLDRLAREFNRTLLTVGDKGLNRYLIDVNPYYVERVKGNGRNVIDGRFVDMQTGLFIDITGLAQISSQVPNVLCKNQHGYALEKVLNLRRTLFEGHRAFIQDNYEEFLRDEYPRHTNNHYGNWAFNSTDSLWHNRQFAYDQDLGDAQAEIIERFFEIERAHKDHDIEKLFDLVYHETNTSRIYQTNDSEIIVPQISWTCQNAVDANNYVFSEEVSMSVT